ncbi:MAG: hypothetical protein GX786_08630 [Clostridiales bacterium]|nr:hypothetical protein [Clostridiales bacterium]
MKISKDFVGGNIVFLKKEENCIFLENELRDTKGDWFYWAFCIEGAQSQKLQFIFNQENRLGPWGAAVSHDLLTWEWSNSKTEEESFTYHFGPDEDKVYFAHHMLYHPKHFDLFLEKKRIRKNILTINEKGDAVPAITIGNGEETIFLTGRHHACESTGSYVLEGVIDQLSTFPLENIKVICIPFVDYTGVIKGDQGKARHPHDHGSDYLVDPIYAAPKKIMELVLNTKTMAGWDFHSPWHKGGINDTIFFSEGSDEYRESIIEFKKTFYAVNKNSSFVYTPESDVLGNEKWNLNQNPSFKNFLAYNSQLHLGSVLETTYFGTKSNYFTQENGRALGRDFGTAIYQMLMKKTQN